ncbi:unnamed protein product, partial [marine sediment metagenome]
MRKLKYTLLTVLLSWCLSSGAWGADQADWPNIYIDADAAGSGVGSQLDPYAGFDEINWTTTGDNSVFDYYDGAPSESVRVRLQRDDTWNDFFVQMEGGVSGYPLIFQPYGTGAKPKIKYSYMWGAWEEDAGDGGSPLWFTDFTTPTVTGAELITNGDFETGLDGDWEYYENQATGDGTQD